MSSTGIIYSIICKVNQKRYIGQTRVGLSVRWKQHIQESKGTNHKPLHRAINKYGVGMFNVRILEEDISLDKLSEREVYWIEQFDTYNTGYNLTTGGEESYTIREDVKEKISSSLTGLEKSDEHIRNIKSSLKSIKHDFKVRGDGKHLRMKIKALNVTTGEELVFDSIKDCAEFFSSRDNNISRAISKGWLHKGHHLEKIGRKNQSNSVVGKCRITGEIRYQFESENKASIYFTGSRSSGIRRSLKNPGVNTYKGCFWYYSE